MTPTQLTVTRRHLLEAAGAMLAATQLKALEKPVVPSSPAPISPALISGVSLTLGRIAARIHQRTSTPQDIQTLAQTLEMLRQHLAETNFNSALKLAAARYQQTAAYPTNTWVQTVGNVLAQLRLYDPTITLEELTPMMNTGVTPEGLAEVRFNGLNRILAHPQDDAPFQDEGICPEINWFIGGFSSAAFLLQLYGCSPEPLFEVLCPAVTVINLVLGVTAMAAWVLC